VVSEQAVVESSVLLANCRVGSGARLREAILASEVEVVSGADPAPGSVVGEGGMVGAPA
jgi:ADP-glucose pyrophosphorylase